MKFDYVIIGAGIAGITTAELLQRLGAKVFLLEKEREMAILSSGRQHGWFHTGSLYSASPDPTVQQACIDNLRVLTQYYNEFPGMNIELNAGHFEVKKRDSSKDWFRTDELEYYMLHPESAPDPAQQSNTARRFTHRHKCFDSTDWSTESTAIDNQDDVNTPLEDGKLINNAHISLGSEKYITVKSFDRPMHANRIISDLLSSYEKNGGIVQTECEINTFLSKEGTHHITLTNGQNIIAKNVIFATGKAMLECLGNTVSSLQTVVTPSEAFKVNVVASAVVVVTPAVYHHSFVVMHPDRNVQINHICHNDLFGNRYSVIADSNYTDDPSHHLAIQETLLKRSRQVFKELNEHHFHEKVVTTYVCYKAEDASKTSRNQHFSIFNISPTVCGILPGKFSLAFSLALAVKNRFTSTALFARPVTKLDDLPSRRIAAKIINIHDGHHTSNDIPLLLKIELIEIPPFTKSIRLTILIEDNTYGDKGEHFQIVLPVPNTVGTCEAPIHLGTYFKEFLGQALGKKYERKINLYFIGPNDTPIRVAQASINMSQVYHSDLNVAFLYDRVPPILHMGMASITGRFFPLEHNSKRPFHAPPAYNDVDSLINLMEISSIQSLRAEHQEFIPVKLRLKLKGSVPAKRLEFWFIVENGYHQTDTILIDNADSDELEVKGSLYYEHSKVLGNDAGNGVKILCRVFLFNNKNHPYCKTDLSFTLNNVMLPKEAFLLNSPHFFRKLHEEYLTDHRHDSPQLQHAYDMKFGLLPRPSSL